MHIFIESKKKDIRKGKYGCIFLSTHLNYKEISFVLHAYVSNNSIIIHYVKIEKVLYTRIDDMQY